MFSNLSSLPLSYAHFQAFFSLFSLCSPFPGCHPLSFCSIAGKTITPKHGCWYLAVQMMASHAPHVTLTLQIQQLYCRLTALPCLHLSRQQLKKLSCPWQEPTRCLQQRSHHQRLPKREMLRLPRPAAALCCQSFGNERCS